VHPERVRAGEAYALREASEITGSGLFLIYFLGCDLFAACRFFYIRFLYRFQESRNVEMMFVR
jgi:hypothetical protein